MAAARLDGRWLTLDNRRMAMIEDADIRNYRPTFVVDRDGVRRYEPAPPLLPDIAAAHAAEPADLPASAPPAAMLARSSDGLTNDPYPIPVAAGRSLGAALRSALARQGGD